MTKILLKWALCLSVAVIKLQVASIARSSREMAQTVRIDCQHILSRVCVSVRRRIFFIRERHPKLSRIPSRCLFEWSSDQPLSASGTGEKCWRHRSIDDLNIELIDNKNHLQLQARCDVCRGCLVTVSICRIH